MAKILYVEDDSAQRELMIQLLKSQGFDVQVAKNGAVGVEKAQKWLPDIILTDLRMPYMDGFETIKQIRSTPSTANIPVIVISAWTTARYERRAMALGANRCVTKPYDLDDIVIAINEYIAQNK